MQKFFIFISLLFAFSLLPVVAEPTVFIVGDSTASSFDDVTYYYPRYGYGTKFGNYLDQKKVKVSNLALSGRSSKSFLIEPNYKTLCDTIKKGDFLIIGFGHNDEKGETERYTNPNTPVTDPGSFKYSLYTNYIKIALDKKAIPILCTPTVRRNASGVFGDNDIHKTKDSAGFPGGDYSQCIRDLGKELKITVIDNTELTKSLHLKLGKDATLKLHAWTSSSKASVDNTHTSEYGAAYIAYMMAEAIKASNNPLRKYVLDKISAPVESMLTVNPKYKEEGYTSPTVKSEVWKTTDPWFGSVYGDCGGAEKIGPEYYAITETKDGVTMRSGTIDKASGKISSTSDGVAMYFQKIPADKNFTLSATAKIKNIAGNNQVSFGLMVRDAVWIDTFDASLISSYVAAGPLKITAKDNAFYSSFNRILDPATKVSTQPFTVATKTPAPKAGDVINLKIVKKGNDYTVTYGSEDSVKYTVDLKTMDKDFVYAGLFTARQCEIDFSNIKLDIEK